MSREKAENQANIHKERGSERKKDERNQTEERMILGNLGERTVEPGDFPPQHFSAICRYFHHL